MTLILRCELPRVKIARGHGMIRTGHGLTWKIDAMRHVYHETVVTPWSGVPWNMIVMGHGYTMVHGCHGTWIYHGTVPYLGKRRKRHRGSLMSWDMGIPWNLNTPWKTTVATPWAVDIMGHEYRGIWVSWGHGYHGTWM